MNISKEQLADLLVLQSIYSMATLDQDIEVTKVIGQHMQRLMAPIYLESNITPLEFHNAYLKAVDKMEGLYGMPEESKKTLH